MNDEPNEREEDLAVEALIHHLSASKIADQFWCEMQVHLKRQFEVEPTEEMIAGSIIHRSLEEELGPVIEISVAIREDQITAYILQLFIKLTTLLEGGITRELPVIGMIENIHTLGVIDQLEVEVSPEGTELLVISDYKTRNSLREPSYEQKRRNRVQLQIYWFLLHELLEGHFTAQNFIEYFEMPEGITPSNELLSQLPLEHRALLDRMTPDQLLSEVFSIFSRLPRLSPELRAIYLFREDLRVVCSDHSFFRKENFESDMKWALGYWEGKRTPSDCPQKWMCQFCPLTTHCHYFLERSINQE